MPDRKPYVLLASGLDSGGGAGITADCLTVSATGAFPLPAATCLTAQSFKRVVAARAVDADLFRTTLETALEDWGRPAAVKVGLITSGQILGILLSFLEHELQGVPVVWDPVLRATAGALDGCDLRGSLERVLKVTAVFTPNLPEARALSAGLAGEEARRDPRSLARFFTELGARAVLLKGGHAAGTAQAEDIFIQDGLSASFVTERLPGEGVHGGGCALSAAIASFIAQDYAPEDAVTLAKAYVFRGIKEPALALEGGRPPCGHHGLDFRIGDLPRVREEGFPARGGPFPACPARLGLYPVVDSAAWVGRLLAAGVKTLQLRIKTRAAPALSEEIAEAVKLARESGARLFIDDHYELALKAGAYGVHLGMEDLKTADLELIRRGGLRLGVSTHGPYELAKALALRPSYIALGHIFPTRSKKMPSRPQGTVKLALEQRIIGQSVPTTAIGGIKLHNVREVLACGVGSVALITGITLADDPDGAARRWLELVGPGGD